MNAFGGQMEYILLVPRVWPYYKNTIFNFNNLLTNTSISDDNVRNSN